MPKKEKKAKAKKEEPVEEPVELAEPEMWICLEEGCQYENSAADNECEACGECRPCAPAQEEEEGPYKGKRLIYCTTPIRQT